MRRRKIGFALFVKCYLLFQFVFVLRCEGEEGLAELKSRYLAKLPGGTSVSVRALGDGRELLSIRGDEPKIPASCLKLFTTYAALKELGGEYVFLTEFFLTSANILVVRGHGDPSMTEERLYKVADDLYRLGIRELGGIMLDTSLFDSYLLRSGLNPYEAAQSALPINFNTINVRAQLFRGQINVSTTSYLRRRVESFLKIEPGAGGIQLDEGENRVIRVSGVVPEGGAAVEDNLSVADPDALFAELLSGVLQARGINLKGNSRNGLAPPGEPLLVARSKDLSQILIDLNRYSSNFIAGQVAFALGRDNGRYSNAKGLRVIRDWALHAGVSAEELKLFDASGLSRSNQTTASALTQLIVAALRDPAIAPDFSATLPRYGRRGTLKRRSLGEDFDGTVWGKTGYISGVESIAGTFPLANGELGAYAIVTNGPGSKNEVNALEDDFLRDLLGILYAKHRRSER